MNEKKLPGHDMQPDDITCASCGRFVGALTKCPHCGARIDKRLSVRATRYAAVLLALIGLGILYWMSVTNPITIVEVGNITPTMNFAYVCVKGEVARDARIFKKGGRISSMSFEVDDGTGVIPVMAYRSQAQSMIEQNKIPRLGDQISVAGSLSVQADDRVTLRIQVADQIEIEQAEVPLVLLADLDPEMNSVMVEGVITQVRAPQPGKKQPWAVRISDESGQGSLSFWEDAYAGITAKDKLVPGQGVRVRGSISDYKGRMQIKLNSGADIEFIDTTLKAPVVAKQSLEAITVEEINADLKGRTIETEGQIIAFYEPKDASKSPTRIIIEDGTSTVSVVYWEKVALALGERKPEKGTRMQVRGKVDVYKDKAQIKVDYPDQMEFYQMPPSEPAPIPKSIPIGEVKEATKGKHVTLTGQLGKPRSIKSGVIYPLRDKTGKIELVLWDKNIPGEKRDTLVPNKKITVTGEIKLYKGVLEIIPQNVEAIHIH